jgi:hypothetical protein
MRTVVLPSLTPVAWARATGGRTGRVWAGPTGCHRQLRDPCREDNYLDQGPAIPSPRTSSDNERIRVVGVESEPLTDEQMTAAIRALSRLIASYMAASQAPEISTENRSSEARTA